MDEEHVLIAVRTPASNSCLHAGIRLLPLFLLLDGRMHHLQRTSPKFGMDNIHDRDLCLIAAPYRALGGLLATSAYSLVLGLATLAPELMDLTNMQVIGRALGG